MAQLCHFMPEAPLLPQWPLRSILCLLGRLLVGVVFLYAGIIKLVDPIAFLDDIRSYQLLVDPWSALVALFLPWLEVLAGLCVIIGPWWRGGMLVLIGCLFMFLGGLISAQQRGLDVSCGCFGKTENKTNYPEVIGRDLALIAVAVGVWWWLDRRLAARTPSTPSHS